MKIMTGGWVWDIPAETEFIEIICNGEGIRDGLVFADANGNKLPTPEADTVPMPDPWYKRVTA